MVQQRLAIAPAVPTHINRNGLLSNICMQNEFAPHNFVPSFYIKLARITAIALAACSALTWMPLSLAARLQRIEHPVQLGETTIKIVTFKAHRPGLSYVHVHENEKTALIAAKQIIAQYGGKVVTVEHGGDRLITFRLHNKSYTFDPNRIFSDAGIKRTLKLYGSYSPEAEQVTKHFAQRILHYVPTKLIIALHNNTTGRFSINSYINGAPYQEDATDIYIRPSISSDNFFLVTKQKFFKFLIQQHFNVILQGARDGNQVGSLSLYSALHGFPYINVEAQQEALIVQLKMLKMLQKFRAI